MRWWVWSRQQTLPWLNRLGLCCSPTLVYTVLGLGWILPTLELIGYRRNKQVYVDLAHNMANYLITVYAIGGLFGTIITVFLAGLLPIFTNIAGALLWPVWALP
ncbi:hypothetical protein [Vulcanisaeta sp. JCM 16161]|uniref:hypothetical protein n=1 Tax=Vulcanisaeta sp. JCM 16161 TaxID=1295372 RepID=UPI001FB484FB|nr:hypothetical protein [Vulcanisaeta sp. JCM 16161]